MTIVAPWRRFVEGDADVPVRPGRANGDARSCTIGRMRLVAKKPAKPENEYDERRDTLVVEQKTTWPPDLVVPHEDRKQIADSLHHQPKEAKTLEYILCPTGLIRHITVTQEDLDRLRAAAGQK
jgi:hypothetical protein